MNKNVRLFFVGISVLGFALLSACGGGGSTPPPAGTAEGLWQGTTSTSEIVNGVVLNTGEFWVLYTDSLGEHGFVHGSSNSGSGVFASIVAEDFWPNGNEYVATVLGNYVQQKTLNGSLSEAAVPQPVTFTSTFNPDYFTTPSLAKLAGVYTANAAGGYTTTITDLGVVTVTEVLQTFMGGCPVGTYQATCVVVLMTGTAAPHTPGNVYDFTLNETVTVYGGTTYVFTGIGYFDGAHALWITALETTQPQNFGRFAFSGTKP